MATIKQGGAQRYGVKVHAGKDNNNGIDIIVEPKNRTITLGATTAPLELKPGEDIKLRIFIDRRIVEVFANDRQAVFKQHDHGPEDMGVCLFADGGGMRVREVQGLEDGAVQSLVTRAFPGVCSFHYCGQRERRGATQWLGYDEDGGRHGRAERGQEDPGADGAGCALGSAVGSAISAQG